MVTNVSTTADGNGKYEKQEVQLFYDHRGQAHEIAMSIIRNGSDLYAKCYPSLETADMPMLTNAIHNLINARTANDYLEILKQIELRKRSVNHLVSLDTQIELNKLDLKLKLICGQKEVTDAASQALVNTHYIRYSNFFGFIAIMLLDTKLKSVYQTYVNQYIMPIQGPMIEADIPNLQRVLENHIRN